MTVFMWFLLVIIDYLAIEVCKVHPGIIIPSSLSIGMAYAHHRGKELQT